MEIRNHRFDNLKAVLIFLVVLGHFVYYYIGESRLLGFMHLGIYLFHMPLFIFVSGMFAKSAINRIPMRIERVLSFLILFVLFKLAVFTLFKYGFNYSNVRFDLKSENTLPWYLFAMAVWICLTYLLKSFKPMYVILFSIICGLLVGYEPSIGDTFVASRIFVFFPFFLLGYYLEMNKVEEVVRLKPMKIIAVFILVGVGLLAVLQGDFFNHLRSYLSGRLSYIDNNDPVFGLVYRAIVYALALIISFSVLSLMSVKKTVFTRIGTKTLQIYVLHHFFIWIYFYYDCDAILHQYFPSAWVLIYLILPILLTLLLSNRWLEIPFKKIMTIKFSGIQK